MHPWRYVAVSVTLMSGKSFKILWFFVCVIFLFVCLFVFCTVLTCSLFPLRITWKRLKNMTPNWIQNVIIWCTTVTNLKHYVSNYVYVVLCDLSLTDWPHLTVFLELSVKILSILSRMILLYFLLCLDS